MPRFTFNDGSKNSYGFHIPTGGIDLTRFKKNPIMLDSHWNDTYSVLGNWKEIKTQEGSLTAEPVFDKEDERAREVSGKVERGFIKSCSMGVRFNPEDLEIIEGEMVLTRCELYEVSIVAVPSNANSVQLIDSETGQYLDEAEVQELCLSADPRVERKKQNSNHTEMNKVALQAATLAILGFGTQTTEVEPSEIELKVKELNEQKEKAEEKLNDQLEQQEKAKLSAIEGKVDSAIEKGQFSAGKRQELIDLGVANEGLLDSTLQMQPGKASLSEQVENKGEQKKEDTDVKTAEDFQKLGLQAKLTFKKEHPEQYRELFKS